MIHAVPDLMDQEKKVLWAEAVNTAKDLTNWSSSSKIPVPLLELFLGEPIELPELVEFGKIGFVTNKGIQAKKNFRAWKGMMVGYAKDHPKDSYRLYFPYSRKVKICQDVIWEHKNTIINEPKENKSEPPKQRYIDPTPETPVPRPSSRAMLIPMDELEPKPQNFHGLPHQPNLPIVEADEDQAANDDGEDEEMNNDNDDDGNLSPRSDQETEDSDSSDSTSSYLSGLIMTQARARRMRTEDAGTPRQALLTPTLNRELRQLETFYNRFSPLDLDSNDEHSSNNETTSPSLDDPETQESALVFTATALTSDPVEPQNYKQAMKGPEMMQ